MAKKYRRKSTTIRRSSQDSMPISKEAVTSVAMGKARPLATKETINTPLTKSSLLINEKQVFRDLKWSALVALFIFILIIILRFTLV
jgi:hypothetical protein